MSAQDRPTGPLDRPHRHAAGTLVSVNVGRPRAIGDAAGTVSAIDKRPVHGWVGVGALGLDGDGVADVSHGGVDQAVYAFAAEELDWWGGQLDAEVPPGTFGENLTTRGVDLDGCVVGERWRVGTVTLQVSGVRIPCSTFKSWMGLSGFDDRQWVKRFAIRGRPGVYLSVSRPGRLRVGDAVTVVHRPAHGVTAATLFRALTTEPELLPRLLSVEGLPERLRRTASAYVERTGS